MSVPILRQGRHLIASLQDSLSDRGWEQLRDNLLDQVGRFRALGLIIDVGQMDVMDSYATRSLDGIGTMASLRGAATVVVGIQPEVAFAMTQLGLKLTCAGTALDLDAGLAQLERQIVRARNG